MSTDYSVLQDMFIETQEQNEVLTADNLKWKNSNAAEITSQLMGVTDELDVLKVQLSEKEKVVEALNGKLEKSTEENQLIRTEFNDLFEKHETLKKSEDSLQRKLALLNYTSHAIDEIKSYQRPATIKAVLRYNPGGTSHDLLNAASTSGTKIIFVKPAVRTDLLDGPGGKSDFARAEAKHLSSVHIKQG